MGRTFTIQRGAVRVIFGAGSAERIAEHAAAFQRVLVVATPGRAEDAAAVAKRLGARSAGVLAVAREHVPSDIVKEAREIARDRDVDAVLAYGGGSAIGLAKAVALEGAAKAIAIPTTYSGSEMTSIYGITEGKDKRTGRDERVRPALVLYDPDLLVALPRDVAVASTWNAIAHAVEALWAPSVDRATSLAAEEALRLLVTFDRERALEGAYLAGAAFGDAGSGIHHRLCHQLGGAYGMPHAKTHAALLPHVVRMQAASQPEAMRAIARALGVVDPVRGIEELARTTRVGVPLESLGMPREAIDRFGTTPELRETLAAAFAGPTPKKTKEAYAVRAPEKVKTQPGFGGTHESEAIEGALPRTQNAPRKAPFGLLPELLNGTAFTVRNAENSRVWMYRIRGSFSHDVLAPLPNARFAAPLDDVVVNRTRWRPLPIPGDGARVDFLDGLVTLGGADAGEKGYRVHLYAANADMSDRAFADQDGDLLIVPQEGALECRTELGWLRVEPGSFAVVPRAIKFAIGVPKTGARGWMLEVIGPRLRLPERGLIGSNGLADARHFQAPVAAYEDRACDFQFVTKLGGRLFAARQSHSPFDVVAWHGNHVPFTYDLSLFCPMGSVRFDHQDPSIHTVLTAPLDDHGRAITDFVAFVPRWEAIEHSFRPPFMHRNAASEVNMVVRTSSPGGGYDPGCTFLSPLLTAHGVATKTYDHVLDAPQDDVTPARIPDDSLWTMFESALPFYGTAWARETDLLDPHFLAAFAGMRSRFSPPNGKPGA